MALVWVTGVPGSGKSSVCASLKAAGHHAVDADWEGYNRWVHRRTGEVIADPPYPVPDGWLETSSWQIDPDMVRALAGQVRSTVGFLFGAVENEIEVWDHFDRVICLVIDDETLRHRLTTRTTNPFGKQPDQLAAALSWNQTLEAGYRSYGAEIIDATRPLEAVVEDVAAVARRTVRDIWRLDTSSGSRASGRRRR